MQASRRGRLAEVVIGIVAFTGMLVAGQVPPAASDARSSPPGHVAQVDPGTGADGERPWPYTALTS